MPSIHTPNANDHVQSLIDRSMLHSGLCPVPLIATSYDIKLAGGLASVTARRTFRNQEADTIEAALTFPVPVHAVLYALEARIGDRMVTAVAKGRKAARDDYEDAVDSGKSAVLHEELLRGIHMLSVAHVPSNTEIEVSARFAMSLCWIGGLPTLRIPTTVGDVYGASPLSDSDELINGGPVQAATLNVVCEPESTATLGGVPIAGTMRVSLDRPITLEIGDWKTRRVQGASTTGENFALSISPLVEAHANIDIAVLIDHSGSMSDNCHAGARVTKHTAVMLGLSDAFRQLGDGNRINLWQFDDRAEDLGTAHGRHIEGLIQMLAQPRGGTEIGAAIDALLHHRRVRDVVLVTDGKSHSLDVHRLAQLGVRFSIVLIGDDSLEANVGHLAALTGGEIFVTSGSNVAAALRSVLVSIRAACMGADAVGASSTVLSTRRGGMRIEAKQTDSSDVVEAIEMQRAAGALVASLRTAMMPAADAEKLAIAEGLVTHLTSLILVDDAGKAQAGLPAMRKVALPRPATSGPMRALSLQRTVESGHARQNFSYGRSKSIVVEKRKTSRLAIIAEDVALPQSPFSGLSLRVDWRNEGQRLVEGNLIGLSSDVADAIDAAANSTTVKRAAKRLGVSARQMVIGLLARKVAMSDRYAERVFRAILARAKARDIAKLAEELGLSA